MKSRLKIWLVVLFAAVVLCPPSRAVDVGPAAPAISQLVSRILEQDQYEHKVIDDKTSHDLLDLYLEMYDPNRMFFEKDDVDGFKARFGDDMAQRLKDGDVEPAYIVFNEFMQRLQERVDLVHVVASSSFTFTQSDSMVVDRRKAPWPASDAEAKELWQQRIKYELLEEKINKTKPADRVKNVVKGYDRLLANYKEFDSNDVLQNCLTALAHTFDPHSDYMAAPQEENFDISMRLSLVGIGAVLGSEDGYAKIVSLVPGGPAERSKKLKANDRIEAVAQGDEPFVEAVGMKLDRLVELIRGTKGTTVRLRIIPTDALNPATRVVISLVRDEIKLKDQEAKARIINLPEIGGPPEKIGVIDLPSFYADMRSDGEESATKDVKKLIDYLEKQDVAGLILDLRGNGGGSLTEAVAMTGLFVPGGPVVQVKDTRGDVRVLRAVESKAEYSGPLVVLTGRGSASASEIVTAALQDYHRAIIVGEKSTFGKGTVQSIVELGQYMPWSLRSYKPGALKYTIQKFYRISGGSTQNRGVIPDIHLPALNDYMDIAESSLPNALPYDQIAPASYHRLTDIFPAEISRLEKASQARVAASQDFIYEREDIARYQKEKKKKTVSLNYDIRLQEKKEDDDRELARKKERAARKTPPLAITDITLEDIDSGFKSAAAISSSSAVAAAAASPVPAVIASTAAASSVALSTANTQGVASSTSTAEGEDYAKAPDVPDFVLEEAARVVADIIDPAAVATQSASSHNAATAPSAAGPASPNRYVP